MIGIKNYKGDRDIDDNKYHLVSDSDLLLQQLQNFINLDEGSCTWDIRHGLSRKILFSTNQEAIKSEIKNKILEYYGDRVLQVYDMMVTHEGKKISFTGKIETIYKKILEIGGSR